MQSSPHIIRITMQYLECGGSLPVVHYKLLVMEEVCQSVKSAHNIVGHKSLYNLPHSLCPFQQEKDEKDCHGVEDFPFLSLSPRVCIFAALVNIYRP